MDNQFNNSDQLTTDLNTASPKRSYMDKWATLSTPFTRLVGGNLVPWENKRYSKHYELAGHISPDDADVIHLSKAMNTLHKEKAKDYVEYLPTAEDLLNLTPWLVNRYSKSYELAKQQYPEDAEMFHLSNAMNTLRKPDGLQLLKTLHNLPHYEYLKYLKYYEDCPLPLTGYTLGDFTPWILSRHSKHYALAQLSDLDDAEAIHLSKVVNNLSDVAVNAYSDYKTAKDHPRGQCPLHVIEQAVYKHVWDPRGGENRSYMGGASLPDWEGASLPQQHLQFCADRLIHDPCKYLVDQIPPHVKQNTISPINNISEISNKLFQQFISLPWFNITTIVALAGGVHIISNYLIKYAKRRTHQNILHISDYYKYLFRTFRPPPITKTPDVKYAGSTHPLEATHRNDHYHSVMRFLKANNLNVFEIHKGLRRGTGYQNIQVASDLNKPLDISEDLLQELLHGDQYYLHPDFIASDVVFLSLCDFYVDLPELLSFRKPVIIITKEPYKMVSSTSEVLMTTNDDSTSTTTVMGGGQYRHHIHRFDRDFIQGNLQPPTNNLTHIITDTYTFNQHSASNIFNVDRYPFNDTDIAVFLTPLADTHSVPHITHDTKFYTTYDLYNPTTNNTMKMNMQLVTEPVKMGDVHNMVKNLYYNFPTSDRVGVASWDTIMGVSSVSEAYILKLNNKAQITVQMGEQDHFILKFIIDNIYPHIHDLERRKYIPATRTSFTDSKTKHSTKIKPLSFKFEQQWPVLHFLSNPVASIAHSVRRSVTRLATSLNPVTIINAVNDYLASDSQEGVAPLGQKDSSTFTSNFSTLSPTASSDLTDDNDAISATTMPSFEDAITDTGLSAISDEDQAPVVDTPNTAGPLSVSIIPTLTEQLNTPLPNRLTTLDTNYAHKNYNINKTLIRVIDENLTLSSSFIPVAVPDDATITDKYKPLIITKISKRQAKINEEELAEHIDLFDHTNLNHGEDDARDLMRSIFVPLTNYEKTAYYCKGHLPSMDALISRISAVNSDSTSIDQMSKYGGMWKTLQQCANIMFDEHLVPLTDEEIVEEFTKSNQKRRYAEYEEQQMFLPSVQFNNNAFVKAEPSVGKDNPLSRNISNVNSRDIIELSKYTIPFKKFIEKNCTAYLFSKNAEQAGHTYYANHSIFSGKGCKALEIDHSKFDGRQSFFTYMLEVILFTHAFRSMEPIKFLERERLTPFKMSGTLNYNAGYTRLSGAAETSISNTLVGLFILLLPRIYTNGMNLNQPINISGITRDKLWNLFNIGYAGGDDANTFNIDKDNLVRIADYVGLDLKIIEHKPHDPIGILGTTVIEPATSPACMSQLPRLLGKIHTGTISPFTLNDQFANKIEGYLTANHNTYLPLAEFLKNTVKLVKPSKAINCDKDNSYHFSQGQMHPMDTLQYCTVSSTTDPVLLATMDDVAVMETMEEVTQYTTVNNPPTGDTIHPNLFQSLVETLPIREPHITPELLSHLTKIEKDQLASQPASDAIISVLTKLIDKTKILNYTIIDLTPGCDGLLRGLSASNLHPLHRIISIHHIDKTYDRARELESLFPFEEGRALARFTKSNFQESRYANLDRNIIYIVDPPWYEEHDPSDNLYSLRGKKRSDKLYQFILSIITQHNLPTPDLINNIHLLVHLPRKAKLQTSTNSLYHVSTGVYTNNVFTSIPMSEVQATINATGKPTKKGEAVRVLKQLGDVQHLDVLDRQSKTISNHIPVLNSKTKKIRTTAVPITTTNLTQVVDSHQTSKPLAPITLTNSGFIHIDRIKNFSPPVDYLDTTTKKSVSSIPVPIPTSKHCKTKTHTPALPKPSARGNTSAKSKQNKTKKT
jgi:hypothetical protein